MSLGAPHDYGCTCERCVSRRAEPLHGKRSTEDQPSPSLPARCSTCELIDRGLELFKASLPSILPDGQQLSAAKRLAEQMKAECAKVNHKAEPLHGERSTCEHKHPLLNSDCPECANKIPKDTSSVGERSTELPTLTEGIDLLAATIIQDVKSGEDAEWLLNRVRARINLAIGVWRSSSLSATPDWRKMCIVEIAVENQSVADYVEHWEGRALKAEAQLAASLSSKEEPSEGRK